MSSKSKTHNWAHTFTAGIEWMNAPLDRPHRTMFVLWSVRAFVRFHSIAKSQLNETFTIASKIHFSSIFYFLLRYEWIAFVVSTAVRFFLHFSSSLECMTHFQWAHKKEFNVLTCSLYLANWKFIQIFEKSTQLKMYLWGSQICVYFNLYRNKIDCDDHTTIDPQFIHLNIYWIGNWSSF